MTSKETIIEHHDHHHAGMITIIKISRVTTKRCIKENTDRVSDRSKIEWRNPWSRTEKRCIFLSRDPKREREREGIKEKKQRTTKTANTSKKIK